MPRVTNPVFRAESKPDKSGDRGFAKFLGYSLYATFLLWLLNAFGYIDLTAGIILFPLWGLGLWLLLGLTLIALVAGAYGLAVAATNGLQKRVQSV